MTVEMNENWASPYAIVETATIGQRIDGVSVTVGEKYDIVNPANGAVIAQGNKASKDTIAAALASSAWAFTSWRATPVQARAAVLNRAATLIRDNADELALTMTLEQGKPLLQSKGEFLASAETFDWYAAEALRISGRVLSPRAPGGRQLVLPQPIGPVAAFTPWNFPALLAVRKVAPAIAAGCTCILKPAEETPGSAVALADALTQAGLPAGVLNVLFGEPAQISEALISSDVIRKVTLTGSVPVGKTLSELAGRYMKPCTMELGGHSPVLVMDDADPVAAATASAISKTRNAGQVCISPTRFFVQDGVYDSFIFNLIAGMKAVKIGDGSDAGSDMGPMANTRRVVALEALIEDAISKGAKLETGGNRVGNSGYFFEPTVLSNVPDDAEIMTTEPFGPIAIVNRFAELDEAIDRANRNDLGLAAYAFTNNHPRAVAISEGLDVGMIAINSYVLLHTEAPLGGVKDSGYGVEGGSEGLSAYMHTKYVHHA